MAVENNHLVLAVPAKKLFFAPMRLALHQHLIGLAYLLLVVLQRNLTLQGNNLLQSACLHLVGHIIHQMFFGIGVGAHRKLKHIGIIISHLSKHLQRHLVFLLRLAAKAGYHIRRYRAVGHIPSNRGYAVQIPSRVIVPIHQLQHPVAPTLHRQMDAFANIVIARHHLQQFVAQILRV